MSATFSLVGTYDGSGVTGLTIFQCSINKGNYAYIGALDGLWIIDITDPTNPIKIYSDIAGTIGADIRGLAISDDGNTLYMAANDGDALPAVLCVDITTKSAPVLLGGIELSTIDESYQGFLGTNQALLLLDSTHVCALVYNNNTPVQGIVQTIDVSNPITPTAVANPIGLTFVDPDDVIKKMASNANAPTHIFVSILNANTNVFSVAEYNLSAPASPSLTVASPTLADISQNDSLAVDGSGNVWGTFVNAGQLILFYYASGLPDQPNTFPTAIDAAQNVVSQISVSPVANGLLVSVDHATGSDVGATRLFDISDPNIISQLHVEEFAGGSVSFAYPHFYTTNISNAEGPNDQFYSWLVVGGGGATGWSYGDNNVIYTA